MTGPDEMKNDPRNVAELAEREEDTQHRPTAANRA